jgi:hypothetical protein
MPNPSGENAKASHGKLELNYTDFVIASKRHCDYLTGLWLVKRFLYGLQRKLQPSRGDRFGFCQRLHSRKRLSGRETRLRRDDSGRTRRHMESVKKSGSSHPDASVTVSLRSRCRLSDLP